MKVFHIKNANNNIKNQNTSTRTIYKKHSQMIEYFEHTETTIIPNLEQQLKLQKKHISTLIEGQMDEYLDVFDKISDLRIEIRKLRNEKKRYFLDNSEYIFNYFEEKKLISNGEKQNVNVLNSFFKIKNDNNLSCHEKTTQIKKYCNNYWKNVNNEITNMSDFVVSTDICHFCNKGEFIPQDEEGILICNNYQCGKFISHIIDSSKPSNKEPPNEISYTAYIRLNHFKEILSQFQAKETTQIPDSVIEDIRNRIKKERIHDFAKEINYDKMRDILRKLGYNKYFEHIQYINSIFGIRPPIMNEELHETLCVLFIEIQKPWAIHCPANRTNFFNYTYTLYQLCVLLDQTQYLPYIPMMKDREKQLEQDMIWKKVCNTLDWLYKPTV
jgi:hypothetical protein